MKKRFVYSVAACLLVCSLTEAVPSYEGPDFNNDGKTDLARAWDDNGSVSVRVGVSSGTGFTESEWLSESGTFSPTDRFFYGDFNGDGNSDAAKISDQGGISGFEVFISNGSASLSSSDWTPASAGAFLYTDKWFTGDFNGDGKTDLARVYKDSISWSIEVYLSTGAAFDTPVVWSLKKGSFHDGDLWLSGDFDGDGSDDFAVVEEGTTVELTVHLSTGTAFAYSTWGVGGTQGSRLPSMKWVAADFTGDGKTDIAKLWDDGGDVSIDVHVSTGASFTKNSWTVRYGAFVREYKWFVADFNGDNIADIARLWNEGGNVRIRSYRSTGSGFALDTLILSGATYRDQNKYFVGDFNGDGSCDVAVTWGDASSWKSQIISGGLTAGSITSRSLGSYYSAYDLGHPIWGDSFLELNEIEGAVSEDADLQAVLDAGNDLFLIKDGIYDVSKTLTYRVPYQRVETHNAMLLSDYAILRQQIDLGEQDELINGRSAEFAHLENVICDGNKYQLGQKKWVPGQGAMVAMGVKDGHWIKRAIFYNTRTWSTCQIHQSGDPGGALVENNYVLGAGNGPRGCGRDLGELGNSVDGGTGNTGWADGFSVGARGTTLRENFIMDCTDVGIVLFGVPNGKCHDNFIFNYSRESLGGINLVDGIDSWDLGPSDLSGSELFDFRGLRIENNTISAEGARIQLGLPISNQAWVPETPEVFDFGVRPDSGIDGAVLNNTLKGEAMGYGYILSHIRNITFAGNVSEAIHSGEGMGSGDNGGNPDDATAFLWDPDTVYSINGGTTSVTENDPDDSFVDNTAAISHLLYMNGTPYNEDGYHYYAYMDPEAGAIVKAAYLEILGRAPNASELTAGKDSFLNNDLQYGDAFRRTLMGYAEFKNKFGDVGSENLHVFRTARWRDRIIALDDQALIETGNYPDPEQLHDDILTALNYNALSDYNANITDISPSLPTFIDQGDEVTVSVTVQNTGTTAWQNTAGNPQKIAFASVGDDGMFGATRYYLPEGATVAQNQSCVFEMTLSAPPVAYDADDSGPTAFPYDFKMLKESVGWFGEAISDQLGSIPQIDVAHCPIAPPGPEYNSTFISQVVPASVQPGAEFPVEITFKNSGNWTTVPWSKDDGFTLGSENPRDNTTWGSNRIHLNPTDVVVAGDTVTLYANMTAPLTTGTYAFQWQLLSSLPGVGWFGARSTSQNINVTTGAPSPNFDYSNILSVNVPANVAPGESMNVGVTVRNDGTTTWTPAANYKLGEVEMLVDRTGDLGNILTSQYSDSPFQQGLDELFDDQQNTHYYTGNGAAWVQCQFANNQQHTVKKYALSSSSIVTGSNRVSDYSFELQDASWTMGTATSSAYEEEQDGNRSLRLDTGAGTVWQDIAVTSGRRYKLSFWYYAKEINAGQVVFDTNDEYDSVGQKLINSITSGWVQFSCTFVTGDNSIRLRAFGSGFDGMVYIDNVVLIEEGANDPKSWNLVGSNDGSNWTTLDVRSNQEFLSRGLRQVYDISTPGAYKYYRLNVVSSVSGTALQFSELELLSGNSIWTGTDRIEMSAGSSIAPNQTYVFSTSMAAPATPGTYTFQARMIKDSTWFGPASAAVDIVSQVDSVPVVSFDTPSGDMTLLEGDDLHVVVAVSDTDGISQVRLYKDGVKLARNEGSAPYEWGAEGQNDPELQNLPIGTFMLTAEATDSLNNIGQTVGGVSVRVNSLLSVSNLVINPTFEHGADSWTLSNSSVVTDSSQDGSRSVRITTASSGSTKQTVPIVPGTDYDVSVWINAAGMTVGNAVLDTSDKYDDTCQFVIGSANSGWEQYTGTFTATNLELTVRMFTEAAFAGTVYFDSIVVKEHTGPVNTPPEITSTPGTSATENAAYSYTVTATDNESDPLTYAAPTKPSWLTFSGNVLSGTPSGTDIGTHAVTLTVSDGTDTTPQSFDITVSAVPIPQTLVQNGSFEDGGATPGLWNVSAGYTRSGEDTYVGVFALKGNGTGSIGNASQTIDLIPNTNYTLSFKVKFLNGGSGSIVFDTSDKFDPGMTPGGDGQVVISTPTGNWETYTGSFNSASETSVTIRFFTTSGFSGTFYADDVRLESGNIVKNPSFEIGGASPTNWIVTGSAAGSADTAQQGTQSARINGANQYFKQTVPLEIGTNYNLSVWINTANLTAEKVVFDTQDLYDDTCQFVVNPGNGGWTQYTGSFVATNTSMTLRFFAASTYTNFAGAAYCDNIILVAGDPAVSDGYTVWATANGVGDPTADDDGDGLVNLLEYATGGDPTSSGDVNPILVNNGGQLEYIYKQRNDDLDLVYKVEICTDLVTGSWTDAGIDPTVTGTSGEYDDVKHTIPADVPKTYIRLKVENP